MLERPNGDMGNGVRILADSVQGDDEVLNPGAVSFIADLERKFGPRRCELLARRNEVQAELDAGRGLHFLPETAGIRESDWTIAPVPADLHDRRVEITGPADRKTTINALNSGARVFMADFEDANTPTWRNLIEGQRNLTLAIERSLNLDTAEGRHYGLRDEVAVLMTRPRGWHLDEKHFVLNGAPVSAALFDFGLYFFNNAKRLLERGTGPYFYLPKLESHLEARLWNDVFSDSEDALGLRRGTIKATVLIETIPAVFEMDEILWELREHSAGLNAGRWDYLFSIIKKFRAKKSLVLADRDRLTMTVPFMRAYTGLLVKTCHRRGAHAIGGMAAFIPSRKHPAINETAIARVREDKRRESSDGFDGTWVAHPDLVPVATAVFDSVLARRANQLDRQLPELRVTEEDLLDFSVPGGVITLAGLRSNVSVGLRYIESWLSGTGAAAIDNLMEDTATAEIARSLCWLWEKNGATLDDGRPVSAALIDSISREELEKMTANEPPGRRPLLTEAAEVFADLVRAKHFEEFLTYLAYRKIA